MGLMKERCSTDFRGESEEQEYRGRCVADILAHVSAECFLYIAGDMLICIVAARAVDCRLFGQEVADVGSGWLFLIRGAV